SATPARCRARRGTDFVKRRDFLGAAAAAWVVARPDGRTLGPLRRASWLLVPMDDAQSDHLKAYGVTFRVLERGGRAEWFLNYRNGAFLLPGDPATQREAAVAGVSVIPIDDAQVAEIRAELGRGNMDAVPLEKAPKVAVYVPPNAAPWDDAV